MMFLEFWLHLFIRSIFDCPGSRVEFPVCRLARNFALCAVPVVIPTFS